MCGQKPRSIKLKNALTRRQGANCNGGDEKPSLPDTDIYFGEDHDPAKYLDKHSAVAPGPSL